MLCRKDSIGHPALFGTTDNFLKRFQISSLDELPDYNGLIEKIRLLHGTDESSYLFQKDVYDESKDPELVNNADNEIATGNVGSATLSEDDDPIKIPSREDGNAEKETNKASDDEPSEDPDSDKDSESDDDGDNDTHVDDSDDEDEEKSFLADFNAADDSETA